VHLLRAQGHPVQVLPDGILVGAVNAQVRVHYLDVQKPAPDFVTAQVVVESEGLRMNLVGFGSDPVTAAQVAARQWVDGVLPVLHAWRLPSHRNKMGAETLELLVHDHQQHRNFAWRLHVSAVLGAQLGHKLPAGLPGRWSMLEQVFDDLRQIATATKPLLWLEGSASWQPSSSHGSFLVEGVPWPGAEAALMHWVEQWPPGHRHVMVKQFMMLEAVPEQSLSPSLRAAFEDEVRTSEGILKAEGGTAEGWITARTGAART